MTAQISRPGGITEAAQELASSGLDSISRPAAPQMIGASVERELHGVFCGLAAGTIGLHEVTPSILGLYSLGHNHGAASRQAQVDRLDSEAERLWLVAFSREKRYEVLRRRMDGADFEACASSRDVVLAMLRAADRVRS